MLFSTGSSSCSKIVQARSLLTCGISDCWTIAQRKPSASHSWPWMPIREPIVPDSEL